MRIGQECNSIDIIYLLSTIVFYSVRLDKVREKGKKFIVHTVRTPIAFLQILIKYKKKESIILLIKCSETKKGCFPLYFRTMSHCVLELESIS